MADPAQSSHSAPSRRDFLKYTTTAGIVAAGAPLLSKLGTTERLASARYSFATKSTTKLTLWQVDSPTVKGDGFAQLQALAKQFKQKYHIDVTLDYVQFTSGVGSFQEKVAAAAASNNPPDIVQLSGADSYAYTGAARPLNKYLSSSSVIKQSNFIPGQWARNVWAGTVYGIPIGADANALFFWNRDLFKKYHLNPDAPPATWDELLSMSEQISKSQAAKKVDTLGYIVTYGQSWNLVYYYLRGPKFLTSEQGGDTWAPGKPSPKVLFNDENGIAALDYVVQLADANGGAELLSSFSSGFASGLQDPFITGKIAMQCNGNWNQGVYAQYAPHLNYGVSQMPLPPNGVKCSTSGGFCWSIPTKANAPDEAWSFIEFASEPENQLFYVKGLGTNPTQLALLGDRYFQSNPVRKVAVEAIKNARGWGESPWAGVLWQQYMLNARDQAIYHKATPKAALDTAATVVQQSIDSYTRA